MHLAHIVLRRSYLPMMARDVQSGQSSALRSGNPKANGASGANGHDSGRNGYVFPEGTTPQPPPPRFWETMVHDMFAHALKAIDLVKSWIPTRPFARGCTPMMVGSFCCLPQRISHSLLYRVFLFSWPGRC